MGETHVNVTTKHNYNTELQRELLCTSDLTARVSPQSVASYRAVDNVLMTALQNDSTVFDNLAPGLIDAYCAVGIVEGLDVDKIHFDKYGVRRTIADALVRIWQSQPIYRAQLSSAAENADPSSNLAKMAENALNDTLHLMEV